LCDAGFGAVEIGDCVVRQDRGRDIASLCVIGRAPARQRDREGDSEIQALV
jgi:hypothetical protein